MFVLTGEEGVRQGDNAMGAASPFLNVTAPESAKADDQAYCIQLLIPGQANLGQDQEGELLLGFLWRLI